MPSPADLMGQLFAYYQRPQPLSMSYGGGSMPMRSAPSGSFGQDPRLSPSWNRAGMAPAPSYGGSMSGASMRTPLPQNMQPLPDNGAPMTYGGQFPIGTAPMESMFLDPSQRMRPQEQPQWWQGLPFINRPMGQVFGGQSWR